MRTPITSRWLGVSVLIVAGAALAVAMTLGTSRAGAAGATTTASKPDNTSPPTISGTPQEGAKLVGHRGEWSGTPTDYNDFWVRCDRNGGSCANISGAHNRHGYVLTSADVGNTVRFKVQATNGAGSTFASSVPTAVITAATTTPPPVKTGCPAKGSSVPVSQISAPARLEIDQTQISPSNVTFGTSSITVRFHVAACGGSVAGALVYATAVPYNQFSIPNEQPTDSSGWATLQMSRLGGFPTSSKQGLLVVFVRARKSGEPLLGGISTRRLVSFHVSRG